MPVADAASIKEYTTLEQAAEKAAKRLPAAEREVRQHVGDDLYDAIAADDTHPQREALIEGESLLGIYYALPVMNLTVERTGRVVRATGFNETREESMSKRELDAYRDDLRRQALEALPVEATTETDDLDFIGAV